jgi:hypothetical protein
MACQERRMSDSEPSVLLVLLAVVRRDICVKRIWMELGSVVGFDGC